MLCGVELCSGQELPDIEKLMTAEQRQDTGIYRLTTAEKRALTAFIFHLVRIASSRTASPSASGATEYTGTSGGHWIQDNSDGKIITLEDGSMWQIAVLDQINTALWLPVTNIVVLRDGTAVGEYKHILVNKDDADKAHAKYLGRQ